ncbi:MAG TPA: hypothetical protein VN697_03005, partial [Tepidiformaceae bacterium]|nr:hypothetical protein [Tepidiformaceae bacterium]
FRQAFANRKAPATALSPVRAVTHDEKGTAYDGPLFVNSVEFGAFAQAFLALHDVLPAAGGIAGVPN